MKNRVSFNGLIFAEILKLYHLGDVKSYRLLPGWFNISFLVETNQGTYVLRFFRPGGKTFQELEFLFGLLGYLRNKGCPVQEVFPTRKGELSLEVEVLDRVTHMAILSYLAGETKRYGAIKVRHLQQVGRFLEKLHRYLRSFPAEKIPQVRSAVEEFEHRLKRIDTQLSMNFSLNYFNLPQPQLEFLVNSWRADYSDYIQSKERLTRGQAQLIHADLTVSNVLFVEDSVSGVLDFDDVRMGTVQEDLSIAIGAWLLNAIELATNEVVETMWRAYTNGQGSLLRRADREELQFVVELVRLYIWEQIAWAIGPPGGSYLEGRHKNSMLTFERRYREICQLLER